MTLDNRMISDRPSLGTTNTVFLIDMNNKDIEMKSQDKEVPYLYKIIPLSFSTQYFLVFHCLEL